MIPISGQRPELAFSQEPRILTQVRKAAIGVIVLRSKRRARRFRLTPRAHSPDGAGPGYLASYVFVVFGKISPLGHTFLPYPTERVQRVLFSIQSQQRKEII